MNDDKKNEANLPVKKMMQKHAQSDSWRDAQKNAQNAPKQPEKSWQPHKEQEFELDPATGGMKNVTKNEMNAGGVAGFQAPLTDEEAIALVKELIKKKMKEVVRKTPGGGGYTLYAPNKGKKSKPRSVGSFPTKLGAKRAELARFPPKDPNKLKRLRKEVDRLTKDPKKAAEREKKAREKKPKKEAFVREAPTLPTATSFTSSTTSQQTKKPQIAKDVQGFVKGLSTLTKTGPERGNYVTSHMSDPTFMKTLQSHPQGQQVMKQLYGFMNSKKNAGPTSPMKTTVAGQTESAQRRMDFMERMIISKVITKSLTESLFREEKTESEWDDYITKLSKNALAGDSKFQNLQKNINKKTESMLNVAFNSIRKSVGKDVKLKSFGIKKDEGTGQTYLAFSAEFEDVTAEPIYIHVEGGVPKIDLSQNAKVSLTKTDPGTAKLFRAELVTVQERVLDGMDDIAKAITSRDKYLDKLQNDVDGYVAGLSPLQVSLLKQLLVKKYRRL